MIQRSYLVEPCATGGWRTTSPEDKAIHAHAKSAGAALHAAMSLAVEIDCQRGHHMHGKAVLDDSVSCVRCGADLGREQ